MPTESLQCDDIQPWLAAYALGEGEDDPAARAHLMACPKCQGDLREYRSVAGLLPYSTAEVMPPAKLRERLIAAVGSASQPDAVPLPRPRPRLSWLWPRWPVFSRAAWAAVGFALLSLLLLGWNVSLQRQVDQQASQLAASGRGWQSVIVLLNDASLRWYTVSGQQASGRLWTTPQSDQACLVARRLPALPEGQVYQVWLKRAGEQVSGGTFDARNGDAWIIVHSDEPISNYGTVFVTAEPDGGSAMPTGSPVLSGTLTGGTTASSTDRLALAQLLHN